MKQVAAEKHDINVLEVLGAEIRKRRAALGLSQEQLAARCGLHRNYVGSVERGERNIAFLNLLKLANALETSVQKLVQVLEHGSEDVH